ncbi:MAG: rod shape-determining protein [Mycoplasmatales bacterium]
MGIFNKKNNDIGIDLGTANVLICRRGEGVILNQPSVVAVDKVTGKVVAVGESAYSMIGRTSKKIELIRPLREGVIADFEVTSEMLRLFLNKLDIGGIFSFSQPRILICCPTNITTVEKDAIKKVAEKCGAKHVYIEEEPKVAAVGAGLSIFEPIGNMVIDIGGGTTDIAVLSMGDIVNSASLKIAGDVLTNDIIDYIKNKYQLLIGLRMGEEIKMSIGVVYNPDHNNYIEIKGRDLVTGLPKKISISEEDTFDALSRSINELIKETKSVLEKTEPELTSDIINQGIVLTGGGALLKNIDILLQEQLGVPVYVAEDPLNSVVKGTGILLELNNMSDSAVNLI